jgi:hypothetical protein
VSAWSTTVAPSGRRSFIHAIAECPAAMSRSGRLLGELRCSMEKHNSAHNAPVPQFGIRRISQTVTSRHDQA